MGTEQGKEWRVKIGDGEAVEGFLLIGGELSFDWSRSSQEIDESSKDDGAYGSTSFGQQKISIKVNGNVKLPDPGLERAAEVSKSSPPETRVQIVRGAVVKFDGLIAIGNFSTSHPKDGPVTYSFDLANKGAPTVDNLGATA
jgi:predicted secreted protein